MTISSLDVFLSQFGTSVSTSSMSSSNCCFTCYQLFVNNGFKVLLCGFVIFYSFSYFARLGCFLFFILCNSVMNVYKASPPVYFEFSSWDWILGMELRGWLWASLHGVLARGVGDLSSGSPVRVQSCQCILGFWTLGQSGEVNVDRIVSQWARQHWVVSLKQSPLLYERSFLICSFWLLVSYDIFSYAW